MRTFRRTLVMSTLLLAAACGGGDGSTTQPSATAASLTLSSATTETFAALTDTRTATVVARDANQGVVTNAAITWTTSNAAVATVSGSGTSATITATGNGAATITAASGSVQATVAVTVAQKFVTLTLTGPSSALAIGATGLVQGVPRDARNAAITDGTGIAFSSSNRTVAIVDNTGSLTAIAPGATTITATLTRDGVTSTANATVNVSAPAGGGGATSVTVQATTSSVFTPASVTVNVGGVVNYAFASLDHNVIFQTSGSPSDIGVTNNATVSRTFQTAGTFNYTCTLHAGMNGTVIVAQPALFAQMNGANERPTPNNSTANGAAVFTRNGGTVTYTVTYQGISSAPTGLHIHAPANASQVASILVDLMPTPLPNSSGVLTGTFTASAIKSIGGAPAISLDSLYTLLTTSNAYVNVHSQSFLSGEIRGQTAQP